MHSSHRTALTLTIIVFLFAGGIFLNTRYFQTEEDSDVLRADTASEDGLECVGAGGNGCSADINPGEILMSNDLANSSCAGGSQCVQCSEGYSWEGDISSGDCTNPTACRDAGGEGCTFKLDVGENSLGEQGAFGCTGALTYCISCDTGGGYGFDGESCIPGGGEGNCADGYVWNGEYCQRADECVSSAGGSSGGSSASAPTGVTQAAPWTVPGGWEDDRRIKIPNMDGHFGSLQLEFDLLFNGFYGNGNFQPVSTVRNVGGSGGGPGGFLAVIIESGKVILYTYEGEDHWNEGSANFTSGKTYHFSVAYNASTGTASVDIINSAGNRVGGTSGTAANSISSSGQGTHLILGGGYQPDGVHALSGSVFSNVVLTMEPGGPISAGTSAGNCEGEVGSGLCGILQSGGTPRTDGFAMQPGSEGLDGLCSAVTCNFGHEACGTPTVTLTVPDGQTCSFAGFIQNDANVYRNPLSFAIQGNGCAQNITVSECGPQMFDVTCEAGSVTFSASESSVLSFTSVSDACIPAECSGSPDGQSGDGDGDGDGGPLQDESET